MKQSNQFTNEFISRYDTAMQKTASIYEKPFIYSSRSLFIENDDQYTVVLDEAETLITIFQNKEDYYCPMIFSEWERRNDLGASAVRNHFELYPTDKPIKAALTESCLTIHEDHQNILPIVLSEFAFVFPSTVFQTEELPNGVYARFNWS